MRFLFVAKQKKNVDTFETTIAELLARGHDVVLAIQQRDPERDRRLTERFDSPRFSVVACPEERGDAWRRSAPLARSARDWAQYFQAPYAHAQKLHQRALERLLRELGTSTHLDVATLSLNETSGARLRETLARVEDAIPSDPLHEEFIARHAPDVLLVSPGLHFGSGQSDFIKSAQALGIPAWMLLFSWDNLSTKGALHVAPDRMFVWNARQVREADELHGFPAEQVAVVGAPRFDEFFSLTSVVERDAFLRPLRLDPRERTLLYLCSSKFIASDEVAFIHTWLAALRASMSPALRTCNVIVRPHPDVPFEPERGEPEAIAWRSMPQATGWLHRPFADDRALVLRTTYGTPQAFYECLHHADAVVALNTSAELEAGIVGRPVLTVLCTSEAADGQSNTLHFDYLLKEHGGFVRFAPDLPAHERHLAEVLEGSGTSDGIRAFVMDFLRPLGNRPVAPLLADALVGGGTARDTARTARVARAGSDDLDIAIARPEAAEELAAKKLAVDGAPGVQVLATSETRRFRRRGVLRLDSNVSTWLEETVEPGDVFYDIGAGVGTYSLVAAITRGALSVAFEPGFAVYRTLCENIRINEAAHSVIALPLALTDRPGLFELEFSGPSGGEQHSMRNREWRARRETDDARLGHPVCAERLDDVVVRYGIPAPHAIRLNVRRGAERVLAGARTLLTASALKSVLMTMGRESETHEAIAAAKSLGLLARDAGGTEEHGFSIVLERAGAKNTRKVWDKIRSSSPLTPSPRSPLSF